MGLDMKALVVENDTWTMVPMGGKYATYGYETTTPGKPLTVEVNTVTPDKRPAGVSFTYTRAQNGFGGLEVRLVTQRRAGAKWATLSSFSAMYLLNV
jgi:hypothetical protein